jgi:transcriptional regulator with XRE-family HTH domain
MSIGKQIVKARKELNLTQRALAKKIDLPGSLVARWEADKAAPRAKNIEKLAQALGKDYKYFYEEDFSDGGSLRIDRKNIDIPTLGIYQNAEVIFVPSASVPKKEDVAMKMEFDIEVVDDKVKPFKKYDRIKFTAADTAKGLEGNYFIVEKKNGGYEIKKLDKHDPKLKIIGVVDAVLKSLRVNKK